MWECKTASLTHLLPHTITTRLTLHNPWRKNTKKLCLLFLTLTTVLFPVWGTVFKQSDRLISSCCRTCESKCPIEFGTIWATVALCRPVPTAITRPACALRSSLICYRHSSGSVPCTLGIQSFWVPCVYLESWPRIIVAGGKRTHRFPALASTCWLKETAALCPLQLSRQHTVLNATPSLMFRLDIYAVNFRNRTGKQSLEEALRHSKNVSQHIWVLKAEFHCLFPDPWPPCGLKSRFNLSVNHPRMKRIVLKKTARELARGFCDTSNSTTSAVLCS